MIRDLWMMQNLSPLFEKKLIIWGLGKKGCEILADILEMGAGKKGVWLCDSNGSLQGEIILNHIVLSPKDVYEKIKNTDMNDLAILVTAVSTKAQDEIISAAEEMYGGAVDIYTEYALEWGIYYGLRNPNIEKKYREQKLYEHEKNRLHNKEFYSQMEDSFRYFTFLPLHNDEIILIYQPGKVASTTLYKSILNYNKYVLHCHRLETVGKNDDSLLKLLNLKSAKIISLVRDPIERQIAAMWQSINQVHLYSAEADFKEIENHFLPEQFFKGDYASWFNNQMKKVFKIDVFEHPFDQEKGYSNIRKGNIELLLMKMERLNDLEDVIGEFLDIENFKLDNGNVGSDKPYRFAYRDYKLNFKLPKEMLNSIYVKNEHIKHFYSEQEREVLYRKWLKED